jgi:membrane-associated phospholipid phosphatase
MVSSIARRRVHPAEVIAVLGGASVLAGSWVVVTVDRGVPRFEATTFEWLNSLPDGIWHFVWLPMQLGSVPGSLVVVAATAAISRRRHLTVAALVASQAAFWSAKLIKSYVGRARPASLLPEFTLREKATGLGYVSGHSAVAFALAAVLAPSLPRRWRPVAAGLATVVALARVYSGAHLPLDAVGGAGLGVLAGTLARWVFGLGGAGLPVTPKD